MVGENVAHGAGKVADGASELLIAFEIHVKDFQKLLEIMQ